jgi:hypothetical protein
LQRSLRAAPGSGFSLTTDKLRAEAKDEVIASAVRERLVHIRAELDRGVLNLGGGRRVAAYCPEVDRCFLISADRFDGRLELTLRLAPSRNNQQAGINWAEDFDFEARLKGLLGP